MFGISRKNSTFAISKLIINNLKTYIMELKKFDVLRGEKYIKVIDSLDKTISSLNEEKKVRVSFWTKCAQKSIGQLEEDVCVEETKKDVEFHLLAIQEIKKIFDERIKVHQRLKILTERKLEQFREELYVYFDSLFDDYVSLEDAEFIITQIKDYEHIINYKLGKMISNHVENYVFNFWIPEDNPYNYDGGYMYSNTDKSERSDASPILKKFYYTYNKN